MNRTRWIVVAVVVVLIAAAGVFLFVVAPAGSSTAGDAAIAHVKENADPGTAKVLAQQQWGDGSLVLVGYDRRGARRLGLSFADEGIRGWRIASYTEKQVEPDDVVVGSLLVAHSGGGKGQPAWSAAVGELVDTRIDRIQVKWSTGQPGLAPATGKAYLVVSRGSANANEVVYLAKDGTEIARVPVSAS